MPPLSHPGSKACVAATMRWRNWRGRYRVAYSVDPGPPYTVMHSNAVFFFDRDGKARLVTTDTGNPAAMAEDVERLLN